jgi:uncharacterized protein
MNIIVFGATGLVGKELVRQALLDGHHVKAYGRNVFVEDLSTDNPKLELIQGALFDGGQVFTALKNCDVVLSALGGGIDGTDKTRSLGIKNIVTQMQKANIKRIIAVGGDGVLNFDEDTLLLDQENYPQEYLAVSKEHLKAYEYLKESNVDWTFVCAPNIIAAQATGSFTTYANYVPIVNKNSINAGDIALFMLKEMSSNAYVKQRVGISN